MSVKLFATVAAMLAVPSAAWAVDCTKWSDHTPGYCGVLGNDMQCNSSANRVPGKCAIPAAPWYVNGSGQLIDNQSQSVLAGGGAFALFDPGGSPISLVAAGGGNLVAAGGGNIVAQGGGNMVGGRTLMGVGSKKVFIVKK